MAYGVRDLARHLDRRRSPEADIVYMRYLGPGDRIGTHRVETTDRAREVVVGSIVDRTYRPGSIVPVGSHTGTPGGRIILGSPPPERTGASAGGVLELARSSPLGPPSTPGEVLLGVRGTAGTITAVSYDRATGAVIAVLGSASGTPSFADVPFGAAAGPYVLWREGETGIRSWDTDATVTAWDAAAGELVSMPVATPSLVYWVTIKSATQEPGSPQAFTLWKANPDLTSPTQITSQAPDTPAGGGAAVSWLAMPDGMLSPTAFRSVWLAEWFVPSFTRRWYEIELPLSGAPSSELVHTSFPDIGGFYAIPAPGGTYSVDDPSGLVNLSTSANTAGSTFSPWWPQTGTWPHAGKSVSYLDPGSLFLSYDKGTGRVIIDARSGPWGSDPAETVVLDSSSEPLPDVVYWSVS